MYIEKTYNIIFYRGSHDLTTKTPFLLDVGFCVYDICKSIIEVNDGDIGKVSVNRAIQSK